LDFIRTSQAGQSCVSLELNPLQLIVHILYLASGLLHVIFKIGLK